MRTLLVRLVGGLTAALLLAAGLVAGPQQAAACACGAVVSDTMVTGEVSIVAWNGTRQSIDMRMLLDDATETAGWIMPTPTPADISLGSDSAFSTLAAASAPKVTVKRVFRFSLAGLFGAGGTDGAPQRTGAHVLRTTQVGPFTVTTLTGSKATEVNDWLQRNDYPSRDDLVPTFQDYLDRGWVLQAVKLTPQYEGEAFEQALPTLRMTFETDEPVYPLQLSRHARTTQQVRLYLLSDQPLKVTQQAGPDTLLELLYSGKVDNSDLDNPLLTGRQVHLTTWEATYEPEVITRDLTFGADPTMADYQNEWIVEDNVADGMVTLLVVGVLLAAPVVVIALVVRRVSRAARRG